MKKRERECERERERERVCVREGGRDKERDILEDIVKKQTEFMNRVLLDNLDSKEKEEISKECLLLDSLFIASL